MTVDFGSSLIVVDSALSVIGALRLPSSSIRAIVLSHMSPRILVRLGLIDDATVNRLAFATIRNPYDRFVSAWNYGKKRRFFPYGASIENALSRVNRTRAANFQSSEAEGILFLRRQGDYFQGFNLSRQQLIPVEELSNRGKLYDAQTHPIEKHNKAPVDHCNYDFCLELKSSIHRVYSADLELWEELVSA